MIRTFLCFQITIYVILYFQIVYFHFSMKVFSYNVVLNYQKWKRNEMEMHHKLMKFPSLAASEVVRMTNLSAASDKNFINIVKLYSGGCYNVYSGGINYKLDKQPHIILPLTYWTLGVIWQ